MNLQTFLRTKRKLLVLTGAGCSTGSGIGDYRDTSGHWKRMPPVQHQDFMRSETARQRYWARSQLGYPEFMRAMPNAAHEVLVRWQSSGRLKGVITQNVDRLHQKAGHQPVIDLHGRLDQVVCTQCNLTVSRDGLQLWLDRHNPKLDSALFELAPDGDAELQCDDFSMIKVPACSSCGGILKPNVVFFGDTVPGAIVNQAYAWVDGADGLLVVGSSLMVFSGLRFVRRAHAAGIPVVAINRGKTRADDLLSLKLEGDIEWTLAELCDVFE